MYEFLFLMAQIDPLQDFYLQSTTSLILLIQVFGPIFSFYAQFREIWEHSHEPLLAP